MFRGETIHCYVRRLRLEKAARCLCYGEYHAAAGAAWQTMMHYYTQSSVADKVVCSLGITSDDPTITDHARVRYEPCLGLSQSIKSTGEMGGKLLEGGKYAVFTHVGAHNPLWISYRFINEEWLHSNNIELRDAHGNSLA